jgi:hypothetical protein
MQKYAIFIIFFFSLILLLSESFARGNEREFELKLHLSVYKPCQNLMMEYDPPRGHFAEYCFGVPTRCDKSELGKPLTWVCRGGYKKFQELANLSTDKVLRIEPLTTHHMNRLVSIKLYRNAQGEAYDAEEVQDVLTQFADNYKEYGTQLNRNGMDNHQFVDEFQRVDQFHQAEVERRNTNVPSKHNTATAVRNESIEFNNESGSSEEQVDSGIKKKPSKPKNPDIKLKFKLNTDDHLQYTIFSGSGISENCRMVNKQKQIAECKFSEKDSQYWQNKSEFVSQYTKDLNRYYYVDKGKSNSNVTQVNNYKVRFKVSDLGQCKATDYDNFEWGNKKYSSGKVDIRLNQISKFPKAHYRALFSDEKLNRKQEKEKRFLKKQLDNQLQKQGLDLDLAALLKRSNQQISGKHYNVDLKPVNSRKFIIKLDPRFASDKKWQSEFKKWKFTFRKGKASGKYESNSKINIDISNLCGSVTLKAPEHVKIDFKKHNVAIVSPTSSYKINQKKSIRFIMRKQLFRSEFKSNGYLDPGTEVTHVSTNKTFKAKRGKNSFDLLGLDKTFDLNAKKNNELELNTNKYTLTYIDELNVNPLSVHKNYILKNNKDRILVVYYPVSPLVSYRQTLDDQEALASNIAFGKFLKKMLKSNRYSAIYVRMTANKIMQYTEAKQKEFGPILYQAPEVMKYDPQFFWSPSVILKDSKDINNSYQGVDIVYISGKDDHLERQFEQLLSARIYAIFIATGYKKSDVLMSRDKNDPLQTISYKFSEFNQDAIDKIFNSKTVLNHFKVIK